MKENPTIHMDTRAAKTWLNAEVNIRISRKWLVGGALLLGLLLLLALD